MKHMKKIIALLLAVMMVMGMATTVFAASITIDDGDITGATYQAYQLLKATNAVDEEGKGTTLYAYTLNDKYTSILQSVTGKTEQADIVAYIAALEGDAVNTFANSVYAAIVTAKLTADHTAENNEFASVDQGYYLIVESALGTTTTGATDTYSLLMLDTAGADAVTVKTKEDLPTVEKKVEEKNDSTGDSSWGDSADYDVNDKIEYQITGTVSDKYASYKSYYYSFSDTMDKGLTYNGDAKVYVVNGDSKVNVTEQFDITPTTNTETNLANGFTATANLKELTGVTITADTTIVVEYTATLNEHAVVGSTGNKNKVILEYENDPKHECDGDPDTPEKPEEPGKTPEDINVVFTYEVIVNKVDKDGKALEGAGFTLYKWIADAENADGGSWVAVGAEIKDVTTFKFEKLDEGKYKLVETTVPAGYNKAADVYFTIESTLVGEELTALVVKDANGNVISVDDPETEENEAQFSATVSSGEVGTNVVNQSGTELPETGGIGTTMFYIIGGILVLAAVVLLVTKRRMSVAE